MRRIKDIEVREKTGKQLPTSLLIYLLQLHRTKQIHHPLVKLRDKNVETFIRHSIVLRCHIHKILLTFLLGQSNLKDFP